MGREKAPADAGASQSFRLDHQVPEVEFLDAPTACGDFPKDRVPNPMISLVLATGEPLALFHVTSDLHVYYCNTLTAEKQLLLYDVSHIGSRAQAPRSGRATGLPQQPDPEITLRG